MKSNNIFVFFIVSLACNFAFLSISKSTLITFLMPYVIRILKRSNIICQIVVTLAGTEDRLWYTLGPRSMCTDGNPYACPLWNCFDLETVE